MAALGGARLSDTATALKFGLGSSFQNNLMSCVVKWGWSLDGCARWRKVTVTVTIKLS